MGGIEMQTPETDEAAIERLRGAKAERLKALLAKKPGQKHYKRALRAFLEVDDELEKAREVRLGLL
jgi:hypothetical protein